MRTSLPFDFSSSVTAADKAQQYVKSVPTRRPREAVYEPHNNGGVCGKDERTAVLQDLLVYATKGIAMFAHRARHLGATDAEVNAFTAEALFATITNVDFDPERLHGLLKRAAEMRDRARQLYEGAAGKAGKQGQQVRSTSTAEE